MKKIISHSETIKETDIFIENMRFEFAPDERKLLLGLIPESSIKYPEGAILKFEIIKGHPKDIIEMFFGKAEVACNWLKWMNQSLNRQDNRNKLEEISKTFKQSIRFLKQIYNNNVYLPIAAYRDLKTNLDILPQILAKESIKQARQAEQHLEILVKILEKHLEPKKRPGSPGSYVTDFAKNIGRTYFRCFGVMPTTYDDGPFFKIITQLLLIVGIDSKDPARAVRAAVKSLKTSK